MIQKQAILLIGPPGAGKGTQAELLAEKLDLCHLETSKIIEKNLAAVKRGDVVNIGRKKYFLFEEKKRRDKGELMSPPLVVFWMKNTIKEIVREGKGIVTSGSPRTLYEGREFVTFLRKLFSPKNIKIIFIELKPEESIWRNSHRKICSLMRHPIVYTKETAQLKKCPLDGSKLLMRVDDTPEIIKTRLQEYQKKTFPLLAYFKKQKLTVKKVNGAQSVEKVFQSILRALKCT